MKAALAILVGCALIAASILFIGHWQISAIGFGYAAPDNPGSNDTETVYRLDRWTGRIEICSLNQNQNVEKDLQEKGALVISCKAQ